MSSLREIEKTVSTLWLDKQARRWLLSDRKGPRPESLKDASEQVLASVDRKGIELYAELLMYGHEDVMDSVYPFCSKLLGRKWPDVVEDYLRRFPPEHYNLNRLCSRLSHYFTTYGGALTEKYPFLAELADYEWIELEKMEENVDIQCFPHHGLNDLEQIASLRPVVNPTVTIREYSFDVLEIGSRIEEGKRLGAKAKPKSTLVAVYRHPETHLCKFVELGEASARVVEEAGKGLTYQQIIPAAVALIHESSLQQAVVNFLELVEELQSLRIFVGSVKAG